MSVFDNAKKDGFSLVRGDIKEILDKSMWLEERCIKLNLILSRLLDCESCKRRHNPDQYCKNCEANFELDYERAEYLTRTTKLEQN